MSGQPFYDSTKSYEENYDKGPFGAFADDKVYEQKGEPEYDFLGHKIYLPFGIPAGPLLNSKYIKGAFEKGFDVVVYKTIRSGFFPCHPYPNILAVSEKGDLSLKRLEEPLEVNTTYSPPLSITNSFGVPSKAVDIWQADVQKALSYQKKGQIMILSFMGTVKENQTQQEFIDDFILAGRLAAETGAKVIEADLSCPNIGNEGLVCYNLDVTRKISEGLRRVIGNTPYIMKVGYYKSDEDLLGLAEIANEYADEIAGINTLQAKIVDEKGEQALPGPNRLYGGICGSGIKWAGLDFVKRLKNIRDSKNFKFTISGTGGVMNVEDYIEYKKAGADCVMSATGAMWNPHLAQEVKNTLKSQNSS